VDSVSGHASRWLPLGSRNAANVVASIWSYGSGMRDTGRASPRVSPPGSPRTHPVRDGTTYHAGVRCVSSDSTSSHNAFDDQRVHTIHNNAVRTVSVAAAVAASGGHASWTRYQRNCPNDAVIFPYVDVCPAFSCRYQQTTFRYNYNKYNPTVLRTTANYFYSLQNSQYGDIHFPPRPLHHCREKSCRWTPRNSGVTDWLKLTVINIIYVW